MKVLLAGPGTGKTTNIQSIISAKGDPTGTLVISFTNATVNDLKKSLLPIGVSEQNCMTLHKFAIKYNHDKTRHVLESREIDELETIATGTSIDFKSLCNHLSCTTFDQMIERFVSYAKTNKVYLQTELSKYSTLIVDEYQDFNKNEQELIDLIIEIIEDVYILGDDDQCIYDFKDASNDKIIALHNDATHEKLDHEHRCYRCPDVVVEHATNLIKNNTQRVDKKWEKTGKKGELFNHQFSLTSEMAQYVVSEIKTITTSSPEEGILILSPVGFIADVVADELNKGGVAYKNYFVGKVNEELLIKSWKLRILFGDHKYLNLVFFGYKILLSRRPFYELLKKHYSGGINFDELYALLLSRLPAEVTTEYSSVEGALATTEFKDLQELYKNSEGNNEAEKLEKLFVIKEEDTEEKIKLMSLHKSKGLGAEHVFMVGLVEGIIPHRGKGNDTIESQRRLFYVGMTRAKKKLHLLSSVNLEGRYVHTVNKADFRLDYRTKLYKGKASTFIAELKLP